MRQAAQCWPRCFESIRSKWGEFVPSARGYRHRCGTCSTTLPGTAVSRFPRAPALSPPSSQPNPADSRPAMSASSMDETWDSCEKNGQCSQGHGQWSQERGQSSQWSYGGPQWPIPWTSQSRAWHWQDNGQWSRSGQWSQWPSWHNNGQWSQSGQWSQWPSGARSDGLCSREDLAEAVRQAVKEAYEQGRHDAAAAQPPQPAPQPAPAPAKGQGKGMTCGMGWCAEHNCEHFRKLLFQKPSAGMACPAPRQPGQPGGACGWVGDSAVMGV